jgi:uncharacterized phage protein (TIGR02220 family)
MARMRIVKPEFWTSDQVMELSRDARLAFIGLWNFCDDAGIHTANVKRLKAEVFPCDDDLSSVGVRALVDEMIKHGLVIEYEAEGEAYWLVTGWHHQKIDQPTYRFPQPNGVIPAGVAKRRATNAASVKQGERAPKPPVQQGEQASNDGRGDAEQSASVQGVFAEQSPNVRSSFDGCSPPEGKGMEGSVDKDKVKTLVGKNPDESASKPEEVSPVEQEQPQAEFALTADSIAIELSKPDVEAELIAYLNEKAGKGFESVESNRKLVRARLGEGTTPEKVRAVIDAKVKQWGYDPKMSLYLRPATLFAATNFAQYVGELAAVVPTSAAAPKSRFDLSGMVYTPRTDGLPF